MTEFRWSKIPYPNDNVMPVEKVIHYEHIPLTFFRQYYGKPFEDLYGDKITFQITYPDVTFDFRNSELNKVKRSLGRDSEYMKKIIEYWKPENMLNELINNTIIFMTSYDTPATNGARILSIMSDAYKDGIKICHYFKKNFDIPRPIQIDNSITPIIETPYSPSYPSEAGVCAGITEILLKYFFEPSSDDIEKMINQCAYASFYGGINYEIDVKEGMRLGMNIGKYIRKIISEESDSLGCAIDLKMKEYRNAPLAFIK